MAKASLFWGTVTALFVFGCMPDPASRTESASDNTGCEITYIVDGDTLDLKCSGRPKERIRIMGYDTPETYNARCPAEKRLGDTATNRLRRLAGSMQITNVERHGQDRYGRTLARIWLGGIDLAQTFISENLAVRYSGGRRINWCAHLANAGLNQ